jgi:hypothetical protein
MLESANQVFQTRRLRGVFYATQLLTKEYHEPRHGILETNMDPKSITFNVRRRKDQHVIQEVFRHFPRLVPVHLLQRLAQLFARLGRGEIAAEFRLGVEIVVRYCQGKGRADCYSEEQPPHEAEKVDVSHGVQS